MYGGVGSGKTFGAQWKMFQAACAATRRPATTSRGADFEQLRGGYFQDFRFLLEELLNWKEGHRLQRTAIVRVRRSSCSIPRARIRALSAELAQRRAFVADPEFAR